MQLVDLTLRLFAIKRQFANLDLLLLVHVEIVAILPQVECPVNETPVESEDYFVQILFNLVFSAYLDHPPVLEVAFHSGHHVRG